MCLFIVCLPSYEHILIEILDPSLTSSLCERSSVVNGILFTFQCVIQTKPSQNLTKKIENVENRLGLRSYLFSQSRSHITTDSQSANQS
jgi:hypothetical protein